MSRLLRLFPFVVFLFLLLHSSKMLSRSYGGLFQNITPSMKAIRATNIAFFAVLWALWGLEKTM